MERVVHAGHNEWAAAAGEAGAHTWRRRWRAVLLHTLLLC